MFRLYNHLLRKRLLKVTPPENSFDFLYVTIVLKSTRVDPIYTCAFCA